MRDDKGNTAKRAEFVQQITRLLEDALHQKRLIIYILDRVKQIVSLTEERKYFILKCGVWVINRL